MPASLATRGVTGHLGVDGLPLRPVEQDYLFPRHRQGRLRDGQMARQPQESSSRASTIHCSAVPPRIAPLLRGHDLSPYDAAPWLAANAVGPAGHAPVRSSAYTAASERPESASDGHCLAPNWQTSDRQQVTPSYELAPSTELPLEHGAAVPPLYDAPLDRTLLPVHVDFSRDMLQAHPLSVPSATLPAPGLEPARKRWRPAVQRRWYPRRPATRDPTAVRRHRLAEFGDLCRRHLSDPLSERGQQSGV